MEFFNKKEDVVDVQLTQYGKLLIAKGVFNPTYYAFFDDGIIYDANSAGHKEYINDIEDRIKGAAYPKTQYAYHGVETHFKTESKRLASDKLKDNEQVEFIPSPYERANALRYVLGNSEIGTDTVPLLTVNALIDSFDNTAVTYYTGSGTPIPIPQLTSSIEYKIIPQMPPEDFKQNTGRYRTEILTNQDLLDSTVQFFNGASLSVIGQGLFVEFIEENSSFKDENFEIEVYEVLKAEDTNNDGVIDKPEELIPLYFSDPDNQPERLVSSFFEILFDEQVGDDKMRLTKKVKRGTFVDSDPGPGLRTNPESTDIYVIPDGLSGRNRFDSAVEECTDDTPEDEE